jgi:ABC-type cobalamin/Fe3+-siderophores transport system ATPase subunit
MQFLQFDRLWCGRSLLAAKRLLPLEDDPKSAIKLAKLRLLSALALILELFGLFLLLSGALQGNKLLFAIGVATKIASHLYAGYLHNHSGTTITLSINNVINFLNCYQREFGGLLNKKGLTDAEIKGISLLPHELYAAELNSYPYAYYLHLWTPLICAMALTLQGNSIMALCIGFLGLAAIPLGRWFYKQFAFRQQRELRLAETAGAMGYIETSYQKHLRLTLFVNAFAQLPLALFTAMLLLNINVSVWAGYLAITMGLSGLSGLLAFQKLRVSSQHAVEKASHLLDALCSEEFLISHSRWQGHVRKSSSLPDVIEMDHGIILHNFAPTAFGSSKASKLTMVLPSGDICLLQAPSGYGKSTLVLALLHLVEHTGDFYIVRNAEAINIHSLSQQAIGEKIVFIRWEDLPPSARLIDLFREPLQHRLQKTYDAAAKLFGVELVNLAFKGSDNLIQEEIAVLKKAKKSPFPAAMLPDLLEMRNQKERIVSDILQEGLNSEKITPERVFCTLSDGEQRRVVNLLTIETALARVDAPLVIFDEPLTHLDAGNVAWQLEQIHRLQRAQNHSILIISHHHVEEIRGALHKVAQVSL